MKRLHPIPMPGSLLSSEKGSALPMVGLALLALIGSAGIAIDMSRVQIVQARLSSSLDAAGLAAGATVNTADITTEANKYFNANYPTAYMGSNINSLTISHTVDYSLLTLDVNGTVPTTFMKMFHVNNVAVRAHSEITRSSKGMELVLVMDTTGSMGDSAGGGQTKLQAAKSAATSLVNILYGSNNTLDNLWVGMVPFAQSVNVGTSHAAWTVPGAMNWGPTTWGGCVDAREASNRDVTDDPPSVALFPKYYWPCDSNNQWYGNNSSSVHTNCNTGGSHFGYNTPLSNSRGPNKTCEQTPVTAMAANKNVVLASINTLVANGNTHIVLGAAWAYRMLSPQWRGLWGGDMDTYSLPQDYNTPLMNKVVVLMTDGDNTIDSSTWGAYWYLSSGHLGTTNSSAAVTQLNSRLTTVCTNMKNHNILIYTIAFGTDISTTAQNLLRGCATSPDYYFYSPDGAALQTAFHTIGDSLANLRISK